VNPEHYPLKESRYSSHYYLEQLGWSGQRILDIGCGEGFVAARLRARGNRVTGVDVLERPRHREAMEQYLCCDLARDVPGGLANLPAAGFDKILLLDVLEHLPRPELLLDACRGLLAPGGEALISVPNVANITVRLALLAGRFEYASRGILDRTHLRFYTRRSFRRFLEDNGYRAERLWMSVMPVELALGLDAGHPLMLAVNRLLGLATPVLPGLLGYQIMCLAKPV